MEKSILYQPPGAHTISKFEHLHLAIFDQPQQGSTAIAREIAALIKSKQASGQPCVLGLATGSSPKSVYKELVRMHVEEGLSFKNVITFNLDEYYPMEPQASQSYVRFMNENLFAHIDIPVGQAHVPDGRIAPDQVEAYCQQYERLIAEAGGLDLQVLGIGRTGHIGFNEPGSHINSQTRMVTLDQLTRRDAASDFEGQDNVPLKAITMGVGTILKAKRIILMAWGEAKAEIVQKTVEELPTTVRPASFLQQHKNTTIVLDHQAAAKLVRHQSPWLVGSCQWSDAMTKKAVIWLCARVSKAILKLTDDDYNEHGLNELLLSRGPAYNINIDVFNQVQRTITGWPGGKPNVDDSNRPERAEPACKRVLIFSPHPDDDVISMGGTLIRLKDQKHELHVAYQTSGSLAVFGQDLERHLQFFHDLRALMDDDYDPQGSSNQKITDRSNTIDDFKVKALIRKSEALAALRYIGLADDHIHFLNMPFYETGKADKRPLGAEDIRLVQQLMQDIKPHQIYVAADLADPHGTHRICYDAVMTAFEACLSESWTKDCYVWMYKGAWQEWDLTDIDMAVPVSPDELSRKRQAIFKHQSQKDKAPFPGADDREFWQRAEDRNRATAMQYDRLGLPEYEAIEGFSRYYPPKQANA